ncbi:uncharacterized protein, partial [Callorhinus ursinus]|uniref:uncharacterized protein n=1 Tax=Callorhinus ursinus TaxID=34884 RepID=UPI003CD04E15
ACTVSEDIMRTHNIQLRWSSETKIYSKTRDVIEFECISGYRRKSPPHTFRATCWEGKLMYPECSAKSCTDRTQPNTDRVDTNQVKVATTGSIDTCRRQELAQAQSRAEGGRRSGNPPRLPQAPPGLLQFPALPLGAAAVPAAPAAAKPSGPGFQPGPFCSWAPAWLPPWLRVGKPPRSRFPDSPGFCALLPLPRPLQQRCLPRPFGSSPTRPSRGRTDQVSALVPGKEELNTVKLYAHRGDAVTVYVCGGNPILFELEKNLYPTVYTLWSYPDLLPTFTTWPLVLEKLVGGAGGGARWRRSRRPRFHLVSGIQLNRDQTILNTYELNRRLKRRVATTL